MTTAELREDPSLGQDVGPAKLTLSDVGRDDMSPAEAIAYSRWLCAEDRGIDRRAEAGADDVDEGSLASAFSFLEQSRAGQPLPAELQARLAAELDVDLSRLRVHTDDRAAQAAATLRAQAFTLGDDIYFAHGAFDPTSQAGVELIAHEVAHVAQNQRGTAPRDRKVSRPQDAHERHADEFARRFRMRVDQSDPATVVERLRREGHRAGIPFMNELEEHFGTSFNFVEMYTGKAAETACQALASSAFAIHNIIAIADPSPNRDLLMHELTHIMQMGQRRAPTAFRFGSLAVSDPHGPAEQEARHGQSHRENASQTEIHRAGPDPTAAGGASTADADAEKRFKFFAEQQAASLIGYPTKNEADEDFYRFHNEKGHRHVKASKDPWSLRHYRAALNANTELGGKSDSRYTADLMLIMGKTALASKYRVSRVDGATGRTYAFTADGDWTPVVTDKASDIRKAQDAEKQFEAYFAAYKHLAARLTGFTVTYNGQTVTEKTCTYQEPEADLYRRELTEAIATAFAKLGNTSWDLFYAEVMGGGDAAKKPAFSAKYNRITGNIFEKLVQKTVGGGDVKLQKQQPIFRKPGVLTKDPRLGDDASFTAGGAIAIDAKAVSVEHGVDLVQARDYAKITDPTQKIVGYFSGETAETAGKTYKAVAYAVPGQAVADKVQKQLEKIFLTPAGQPDKSRFFVSPNPSGLKQFLLNFNPSVRLQSTDDKSSSLEFKAPPTLLPGVSIKTAKLDLNEPGGDQIKSGSIVMGIDMAGAFKADDIKKTIQPGTGPVGGGQVENKFTDFKSKLDKLLGPFTADARLTDTGVEATIGLKPGTAKIPQFNVEAATLTAKLTGEGQLSIVGEVGLAHKSGKISGKVQVGWSGGAWSFEGSATLHAGLVEGLSEATVGIRYVDGKTTIFCTQASYEKKFKAVTLTGTVYDLEYDVDKGSFSGSANLEADLGLFGKARAEGTLENNKSKRAVLEYDSPELKYPKGKDPASITGTVGGSLTYEDGKFSGRIRGTANLNIPALKSIAGEGGLGLAVDGHVKADGSYSGTIATTKPLKFGKHFEVPSIACTLEDDGSVKGKFEIKVVDFKYLESAKISCSVDKEGVHLDKAEFKATIGTPNESKFWGSLSVAYDEAKGLKIGGEVSAKIKDGMIAHGALTYDTEKNVVDVTLGMDEISLLEKKITKSLFKIKKQIPLVSFYNLIGIYLDLGFELSFDFDFNLKMKPELKLEGLSMDTFEYTKISAEIALLGQLSAKLIGTPNLGVGLFALSPSILRGGGGLKMPIVGEALIKPSGTFKVGYKPGGEVEGDATLGMMMTFGIRASVLPYAELSVLDDMWNPSWTGDALADFEILKPKELFNFTVDFGKPKKEAEPALPEENATKDPTPPTATRQVAEEKGATKEAASPPTSTTSVPSESGDEGPFSLSAIKPMLAGLPGYATITGLLDKAAAAYKMVSELLGRILKVVIDFFGNIIEKIEAILDGFAKEGVSFMPKMVKILVGDTLYEIIEPVVQAVAKNAEEILSLFETSPPKSATDIFPWALKLMGKVWGIAFNGIRALASALWTMLERLAAAAKKLANYMVQEGMIGVQRHSYYIWKPIGPNYYFVAATQYKIHVLGFNEEFAEDGMITNPRSVVGLVLFEVLEALEVPPTSDFYDSDAGESLRDRWVGSGGGVSLGAKMEEMVAKMKADQAANATQHKKAADLPETPQRKGKPGSGLEPVMNRPAKL